jgi:hypothetical protein
MLIQLSPGTAGSPRSIMEQGERISAQLKQVVPQAKLVQRYVVKNHCDYVDVMDAPSFEVIEHAANIIESLGHRVTDLMTATSWEQYLAATGVRSSSKPARLDPVQEASEQSFPASDAPGWTGSIVTKAPYAKEPPGSR